MEKNKKNKVMIIAVLSLLLLGGVSFAYYVSQILLEGDGSSTSGTTATINNSVLKVEGVLNFNDTNIYPGHKVVSSVKVTATGDNELIPYNLIWNGTNTLSTLNYVVYKTSASVEVSSSCKKKTSVINGAQQLKEECTINNIEQLGSSMATGTIEKNATKVELVSDEFITSSLGGDVKYYYIILEYPNLEEEQNSDLNGTFNGEVKVGQSNTEPDINILAAYIEQDDGTYKESKEIPQSGYSLNKEKSTCSNGAIIEWEDSKLITSNLTKSGTSCYLYFDIMTSAKDNILVNKEITTRPNFTTLTENTTGKIYTAEDDDGTSYYYAGAVDDNWFKFGQENGKDIYWRIIRINGDGTIRLIYNGTTNSQTGLTTNIGASYFENGATDNMYVGFMYSSGEIHGLRSSNTIKVELDKWYTNNLKNDYEKYIDMNAGFCGDRMTYSYDCLSSVNGGSSNICYGAKKRFTNNKNPRPTYKCDYKDNNGIQQDLYTARDSRKGNKALINPIGLISADEIVYAGAIEGIGNSNYYLYTGLAYWTMSPFDCCNAQVYYLKSDGSLSYTATRSIYTVYARPVINLRADIQLSGSGTASDPYIIVP